ncbi:MAG TPA: hypothetical protein PKW29_01380, partial [Clostridia bacterium]|nr:hypothetical protein [Clostridia bacterium]
MADKHDEVTKLRADMSIAPKRPEFGSAVGGYNRTEVNRYLDEQNANAEALKRVFYEKTQELRDELSLLAEENRRLRNAMDDITPMAAASSEAAEHAGEETRKAIVAQVAGILKAKHEAELASRDDRLRSVARSLEDARAEAARYAALLNGKQAQIDSLNDALSEKEAMLGSASGRDDAAFAEKEAELETLRRAHAAVLAEKEVILGEYRRVDASLAALREEYDKFNR